MSDTLELELDESQVTFEILVEEATYIYGKSIASINTHGTPSAESSAVNAYDVVRDDDVVLGTLYIANGEKGEKGDKGDDYVLTQADRQTIAGIVENSISGDIESLKTNKADIEYVNEEVLKAKPSDYDQLKATVSQKANALDLTNHTTNSTIHVTSSDKSNWNSKADYSSVYKKSETYTKSEVNGLVQSARPDDYETVKGQVGANTTDISTLKTDVQALKDEPSVPEGVVTFDEGELGVATDPYVTEGELADRLELKADKSSIKYVNRNLLDNGFFSVNQRGWTTSFDNFISDRWLYYGNASYVNGTSGAINLTSSDGVINLRQRLESDRLDNGVTYTLSAIVDSGIQYVSPVVYCGDVYHTDLWDSGYPTSVKREGNILTCVFTTESSFQTNTINVVLQVQNNAPTITIRAVKLELGDQSTLAYDSAPNYATELLKCQRYYYRIANTMLYGSFNSNIVASVILNTPTQMRSPVSVSSSDLSYARTVVGDIYFNGNPQTKSMGLKSGDAFVVDFRFSNAISSIGSGNSPLNARLEGVLELNADL